ncbi:hypothetical protein M2164_003702 [Streptomyces sp. SAI-208]|uniref:amidohydrolase family protein n=1 Tax=unclassified Streptomyces TaxID=2593676 RepID=UPI002472FFEC|nr:MULTISPECIES: hypothetical protein [unclassified Streptomyces]MDH6549474.1 hypothetical protein [Streptomyces sp. SAI-041]MDH6586519.1 hypothetical protein [Streptomyces sp. SAI-133]MDH6608067.1 hypothetical protein [Streptomyces sp. SAI-208]
MLTIHTADLVVPGDGRAPLPGGAVLVEGRRIAAVEPYEDLVAAHPTARVRRWPGRITPGLLNPHGPELLERSYHPDPREELGAEPLTGEALSALAMTDARWGASARRGVQRLLAQGTVAVIGPLQRPTVIDAVHRSGLTIQDGSTEAAPPPLLPDAEATFAIFSGTECVATVIRGRLLHRRR